MSSYLLEYCSPRPSQLQQTNGVGVGSLRGLLDSGSWRGRPPPSTRSVRCFASGLAGLRVDPGTQFCRAGLRCSFRKGRQNYYAGSREKGSLLGQRSRRSPTCREQLQQLQYDIVMYSVIESSNVIQRVVLSIDVIDTL